MVQLKHLVVIVRRMSAIVDTTIKRRKLDVVPTMLIGTHNGTFHCDEVLACFMLTSLPEYKDAQIVRTRDATRLADCDIVVDVGGVFNPQTHRYDHHQRSFVETMNSLCPTKRWKTKLSSAGLVYVHFGRKFISQVLSGDKANEAASADSRPGDSPVISADLVETVFDKVYDNFMEEIDAVDNGIDACADPKYMITTTLSNRVGHLNPHWNQPDKNNDQHLDKQFEVAMTLAGAELVERIKFYAEVWWPARSIVLEALNKRLEVDPSGEILLFENGSCPWKEHLMNLEPELNVEPSIKFVLYVDSNGLWRVQCVPLDKHSFENRLSLLEAWRGLRDEELCTVSRVDGSTFVHAAGFIGGNKTLEGAKEMAKAALRARDLKQKV